MAIVIPQGKQSYTNDAGIPLVGGRLYTYDAGTTTPRLTWSDSAQTAPNLNPIVLDARGEATVFWNGAYKVELRTAADVPIWTVDNVTADAGITTATLAGSGGSALVGFIQGGVGAVAQTAQSKMRQTVHIKDFLNLATFVPAVVTTAGVVSAGTDCAPAAQNALNYLSSLGGGTLRIEGANYLANAAVIGVGAGYSNITIDIDPNATWYFDGPVPTAPKGHYKAAAFCFAGVETDADYVTYSGATGDYMISAPRPFAAATTLQAGDSAFTASVSMAGILVPGDWIYLDAGRAGWRGLVQEYAQVQSVAGALVTLTQPLRYGYSNATNSLADFCSKHKRAVRPPGNVPLETWAIAGFRRVQPIFNCHVTGNGRVCNLRDHTANGYADFAVFFWCAIGCSIGAIQVTGGGIWGLDCQEFVFNDTKFGPEYATTSGVPSVLMNGTNRLAFNSIRSNGYTLALEEYAADITIIDPSMAGGALVIKAGCRDTIVVGGSAVSNTSPAFYVGDENWEFGCPNLIVDKLNVFSQGAGAAYYTQPLLQAHPSVSPAMISMVEKYFRGDLVTLRDCQIVSTLNPGFDLEQESQAIRLDNCTLGFNASAGITPVNFVLGGPLAARKTVNNVRIGAPTSATLPTYSARYQGQDVVNTGGGDGWVCSRYIRDTVTAHISTTIVQVGTIANYAVGDVVEVLISNGTFLLVQSGVTTTSSTTVTVPTTTGMVIGMAVVAENFVSGTTVAGIIGPTQFTASNAAIFGRDASTAAMVTVGNINKEHTAVVTSVNTGASQITLGTAMPAGYTAVLSAAGGYIKHTRWSGPIEGSAIYDPGNLVDGAGVTTTVTVTGAVLGDLVTASFSLDLQGIGLTAYVSALNTVSVRFQNETGGPIDLLSGTLRCRIAR